MIQIKSYNKAIDYLFSQLPMYQRQGPKAFKKDLTNINALLDKLGRPEKSFKSIHIAGTNGKGTVSHMIAGSLMSQGYKVGLYTSPHYRDFRERIKINGKLIPKKSVIQYVNRFLDLVEVIRPSFFEMTVAMAFLYFKEQELDYAVIETGLGGRLDSTNVLLPLISVITNISLDHTQFLGDTLPLIAREKAGIIKEGVPVVIGEKQEETTPVFEEVAESRHAPLCFAEAHAGEETLRIIQKTKSDVGGPFFVKNLTTMVATLKVLKGAGVDLDMEKVIDGLNDIGKRSGYIGRWQWIQHNPDVLVDSAHNIGGVEMLIKGLPLDKYDNIHMVLGFVNDKNLLPILKLFPHNAHYYFAKADIPRGLDAEELKHQAHQAGLKGKAYTSVRKALASAKVRATDRDLIFVGGSIFTVAEII